MDRELLETAVLLFVVVDPLGSLPVFMAVSAELSGRARRRLALEAVGVAFAVLAGFALGGRPLLSLLDVSIESFRAAGGVVLFLFALTLIFGDPKHERDLASAGDLAQTAVFPLAIPSLASPGAMLAATLLAQGGAPGAPGPAATLALLAAVLALAAAILIAAGPLHQAIGDAGAAAISRVMGMILAAVAADEVLGALARMGALPGFEAAAIDAARDAAHVFGGGA